MTKSGAFNEKKVFLIAATSEAKRQAIEAAIRKQYAPVTIFQAVDGTDALHKALNVPPHAVVTELFLSRLSNSGIVDELLKNSKFAKTPIVIADPQPEQAHYLDALASGQVQFCESADQDAGELLSCLARAFNRPVRGDDEMEYVLKHLASGERLLKEGDKADFVYIVKKGRLRAFRGAGTTLGTIDAGEFVGEMAYINGEARTASVEAITECELIQIPVGTLDRVLYKRPAWSKLLMVTLSKRLKQANALLAEKSES